MPLPRSKKIVGAVAAVALVGAGAASFAEYRADQRDLRDRAEAMSGGNVERGKQAFADYGCGGCHSASGVPQAQGKVGPPLTGIAGRAVVGGKLENRPANLRRWIENPQGVTPGTAMPDLNVTPADSRDLAAFLYTQT
jgi:cytochrome c2